MLISCPLVRTWRAISTWIAACCRTTRSDSSANAAASEKLKASTPLPSMLVRSVELIGLVLARIRASATCAASCGDSEQLLHAEVDWIDSDGCFDLDGGQSWVAVRRCLRGDVAGGDVVTRRPQLAHRAQHDLERRQPSLGGCRGHLARGGAAGTALLQARATPCWVAGLPGAEGHCFVFPLLWRSMPSPPTRPAPHSPAPGAG